MHNYIFNWLKLANEGAFLKRRNCRIRPTPCRKSADVSARKAACAKVPAPLNDEFGAVTIGNIERYNDKAFERWAGVRTCPA